MIADSLNRTRFESSGGDNEETNGKKAWIPTLIIFVMVIVPFFAVLNGDLFDIYFYQGYGFLLNCIGIVFSILSFILQQGFRVQGSCFRMLIYMVFTLLYCAFSALVAHSGLRYIGVVLNTMGTVVLLSYCKISKNMVSIISLCLAISALYCVVTVKGYYNTQISGDSVNSNYLALFGVVIMVYGNIFLSYFTKNKNRFNEMIRFLICAVSFYVIWECKSRGAFLAWLFFIISVYVLPAKWFRNKRTITVMAFVIAVIGVLFTYLYVTRISMTIGTFMGKSTATRMRLWSYFWNIISENPLNMIFGYGTHSELREVFGYGLHNIYIGIWYDVGLIGLLIFVFFIIMTLREAFNEQGEVSDTQIYAIIGFLSFMISDFFAITFTGPLVIWNYMLLGMVNRYKLDESKIILRWKK